jgi:hypothetical protein
LLEGRTDLTRQYLGGFVRVGVMPQFRKSEIADGELDAMVGYLASER